MFLARVTGSVVATQKVKSMVGRKLLTVEPLRVDPGNRDQLVAIAGIDAQGLDGQELAADHALDLLGRNNTAGDTCQEHEFHSSWFSPAAKSRAVRSAAPARLREAGLTGM